MAKVWFDSKLHVVHHALGAHNKAFCQRRTCMEAGGTRL